jgi:hypothetical protein
LPIYIFHFEAHLLGVQALRMTSLISTELRDEDHPEFDDESAWPRRLLHVPTMTSYKWQPGNKYGQYKEPPYHALSYTWGRWELKNDQQKPHVTALKIRGVGWRIPRIDPDHFSTTAFEHAIKESVKVPKPIWSQHRWERLKRRLASNKCNFLWLDVACIDQRGTPEAKKEIGRQARIFRSAQYAYVWLSQQKQTALSQLAHNLTRATEEIWKSDPSDTGSPTQRTVGWPQLSLESIDILVKDPWLSSLWCLQEAFLRPDALLLSREAQVVEEETSLILRLNYIFARVGSVYSYAEEIVASKKALGPQLKPLTMLIEQTGLAALWTQNPMTLLTIARFRKATRDVDRVYGIMQVFGDEFKVGEAKANGITAGTHQSYSLAELEDEFGALLLERCPVLSQMHVHIENPPLGTGWRICTASAIPPFASNPDNYNKTGSSLFGEPETVCKLSTRNVAGRFWGHLAGRACAFTALQRSWERQFSLGNDENWARRPPLSIALDRVAVLDEVPDFHSEIIGIDEAQHRLADWLSKNISGGRLMMFLMAQEVFGEWVMEGDDGPYSDRFVGMIILEQVHQGMHYWHRLGICRWTSYCVKTSGPDEADRDMLLGHGDEWQHIEGLFG